PLLGVIRTNELQEARKIDGGEQFFTRAIDFGYSKNPEETLSIWNKEQVLSDLVLTIRKFKPDVIINRFNHRTPGTTHGHHTASAILSLEAFDLSSEQNVFPQQLNSQELWQPKRLFFNTSWWFYGSQEKFERADKSNLVALNTGAFYPSIGLSNGEIAALSRSQHQSQGFGNTGSRGQETEYLELIKGSMPTDPTNIFEGVNTSWSRIDGGNEIGEILYQVERNFDFKNPAASIPELVAAYKLLKNRTDYWGIQKTKEIKQIIEACSGLFLEVVTESQYTAPGSSITVNLEAINRTNVNVVLNQISYNNYPLFTDRAALKTNERFENQYSITIPEDAKYTTPYWLKEKASLGLYTVSNTENIGLPTTNENQPMHFKLTIQEEEFTFEKNLVYKFNSPVTGEVYQPFQILPEVTGKINQKVYIFENNDPKNITVTVKAGKNNISGTVALQHPEGWKVSNPQPFSLEQKDQEKEFVFKVTPPQKKEEGSIQLSIQVDENAYSLEKISIDYNHIPYQHILMPAEAKVARIPIKTNGQNIGYIAGAGDEIPSALRQIGYTVNEIDLEAMTLENLLGFDAVVVGIRAYNIHEHLKFRQELLFEYVKSGGNLIMQ
ncbi:LmbE family protein, partial [uncultured Planktosalinus sp.]|uniref:LmbE family protein n=1 Tax=uncultured Planktosalinus sp. TaxID=1810935 RepID=UPI0030DD03F7